MTPRSIAQRAASERQWVERFNRKVVRIPESGCWVWIGACSNGYGHVRIQTKANLAHRVSYEMHKGGIPDGLELDHLCRVPCCVNPDHLEPVTSLVNTLRGINSEVTKARYRRITHCPQGHAYDEANTGMTAQGTRYCRACQREKRRERVRLGLT
jgi:hypothetical protein